MWQVVMHQQINLFQPIFRKERKILSFEAMLQTSTVVVVSLLVLFGYGLWNNKSLQSEIDGLKKLHDKRITMLEQASNEAAKYSSDDEAQEEITRLEAELAAERYIVSLLGKDKFGKTLGFSEYLEIFSRRVVQGMWISKFSVFEDGKHMLIQGGSLSADLLPVFLQGLSEEPALKGLEFTVLQMAREEPSRAWIEFALSSRELVEPLHQKSKQ